MSHARLVDDPDRAAEFLVACLDDRGVFRDRHHDISVAHDVQQRHASTRQRFEVIDRIVPVRQGIGLGQAVGLQAGLPRTATAFPLSLALPRPLGRPSTPENL